MATLVSIAEAAEQSTYSHVHIAWLVRAGIIQGRKSSNIWLVDLDSLLAYEQEMQELGTKKHQPTKKKRS